MSDMSVGVSAGEGWRLAQTMGGVMAADKMARLGIVEPELAAYNHHENRKLASMAMHATSKAPYDAPETFLAELDKLRVPNVLVATGEFVSSATPLPLRSCRPLRRPLRGQDPNLVADPGGSHDVVARLQLNLPRAELMILENTGHGSVGQRPTLVGRSFLDWAQRSGLLGGGSKL